MKRVALQKDGKKPSGRCLKGYTADDGYVSVCVHCPEQENHLLHVLVADAFLGRKPFGKEVNHSNGNKQKNGMDNLEYMTKKQNHEHAARMGLKARGTRHGKALLTEEMVRTIRTRPASISKMAAMFGVSEGAITGILLRKNWKHLK